MKSPHALCIDALGKRYRITAERQAYRTMRDSIGPLLAAPLRRLRGRSGSHYEDIWALRDVSFEVSKGEVVGLIGSNGSGKTTLLKILSRITPPTEGRATVRGRVGSLLEVGTGFHMELSGRENVFLSGAILGMSRAETTRKLDEIVAFAEVDRFLDTPVKRYSTGMYLRLAFAVAAHLQPDNLLVDEVLAVGDARFQQRCLNKMDSAAQSGTTVVFVSHNMGSIRSLCTRAIWLDRGRLVADGPAAEVVDDYLQTVLGDNDGPAHSLVDFPYRSGTGVVRYTSFSARPPSEAVTTNTLQTGRAAQFVLGYRATDLMPGSEVISGIDIRTSQGHPVCFLSNRYEGTALGDISPVGELVCRVPRLPLQPGRYQAILYCSVNSEVADQLDRPIPFDVIEGDYFGTGQLPPARLGDVLLDHSWEAHISEGQSPTLTPGAPGRRDS